MSRLAPKDVCTHEDTTPVNKYLKNKIDEMFLKCNFSGCD
jgi:hypothetical protein